MLSQHLQELEQLETLDFIGKGETFVEASFLTPLLKCLGYETHKDYEVLRHGDDGSSFKLRYPPVERGALKAKNYNPDYIPTIRKKCFWIIEAKSPKSTTHPFGLEYVVQGLQYAVHPEIQAKYLLLSNGRHSAIYDVHGSIFLEKDVYTPILEFKSDELVKIWPQLFELLSIEKLRGRIEEDLKAMFDKMCLSSLDERYPSLLLHKIGLSAAENSKKIQKHVWKLRAENFESNRTNWHAMLEKMGREDIWQMMDHPPAAGKPTSAYYIEKSLVEGITYSQLLTEFIQNYDQYSIFRKEHIFAGLCQLHYQSKNEEIKREIEQFFIKHTTTDLPMHNQVECALLRYSRKILVCAHYPAIRQKIVKEIESAPELIKFVFTPTALEMTYQQEIELHARSRNILGKLPEEQLAQLHKVLAIMETAIEANYQEAYSKLPSAEKQLPPSLAGYGLGNHHSVFRNILQHYNIKLV